ncbi:MBL fold metallo-hydrolase [Maribacter sp. 2308TA10-17]|uniref:MBL fold metallo-hydrolase n=1 Tax=Maribacter sp. 2308TA10-17 TaxID=3386276 RepID=UPI0039BD88A3
MKNRSLVITSLLFLFFSCVDSDKKKSSKKITASTQTGLSLVILGTIQDAGSPHIACKKECCSVLFENPDAARKVVSLGVVDHENQQTFLFDATPDISEQLKFLKRSASWEAAELPNGIFLTHAHIGHYSGLMYLGKEATNAKAIPTYVMPKMKIFLEQNGPWSQLVSQKNIDLHPIENGAMLSMTSNLKVVPLQVPHRDEFSETVGFKIIGPNKTALFIPDIDKWEKWETNIIDVIKTVDYAFLDASFYDGNELNTRDISQIPHPFVIESIAIFKKLSQSDKQKIHFIHFNHTNRLLDLESNQSKKVLEKGFKIAQFNHQFEL